MKTRKLRIVIAVLAAFDALTAIGGGVAMLAGLDTFPQEWLRTTPFSDYTVPALLLAIVVGGSSLAAAIPIGIGRTIGILASIVAGILMAGYQAVEVVMLNDGVRISWLEGLYFGPGLGVALAASIWVFEQGRQPVPAGHAAHSYKEKHDEHVGPDSVCKPLRRNPGSGRGRRGDAARARV